MLILALALLTQDAVEEAVKSVSAENMKAVLTELAGDAFEGRNAGTEGNVKAADWIIERLKKWNFEPFGDEKDGKRDFRQRFEFSDGMETANLVAMIPGSDETLKEQIVVVGAHMDHVGRDGQPNAGRMGRPSDEDDIWNGADDNGSGTTCLLEVARAFADGGIKPRRTVVFMWFSAEEWGLLGSRYYTKHPSAPIGRHVAMVNLDMVGRNPGKPVEISALKTSDDWAGLLEEAARSADLEYDTSPGVTGGSDHKSFADAGVPAVHFFTGFHEDYHRNSDHADEIAYDRMAEIGRMVLKLTVLLADRDAPPAFNESGAPVRTSGRTLGINGDVLGPDDAEKFGMPADAGGIWIETVQEGSVAEKAGIREDDVLVEFNGERLPAAEREIMQKLKTLIRKVEKGKDVPVAVIRDKKRVELKVRWDE